MERFDFIIVGGGASGLLLADALGCDPYFREKRIALIEKGSKTSNDRTWCFWEDGPGPFDDILFRQWDYLRFKGPDFEKKLPLGDFSYKMLRGDAFYKAYYARIASYPNIELIKDAVLEIQESGDGAEVVTQTNRFRANLVFSSVLFQPLEPLMKPYPVLKQHFLGWHLKTKSPVFDAQAATFMDFSISQSGNTRFMYILPFSESEAIVEYTLFSEDLLETSEYEKALRDYIKNDLDCEEYEIVDTERGSIPMTSNHFTAADSEHIIHIGIAGGWAKASTGYTFWNSSQKAQKLVKALKNGSKLQMASKNKFWYYDMLLLNVLARNNNRGSEVFSALFKSLEPEIILRFLHEQTSLSEDFRIINSSPKKMFIGAFWHALVNNLF
ncbi:lycopene cyclase family protein [Robiginitalea sp. IMCC43444]|uniref:lycopene cyclase family protein n=1 Tax=Robiginitalea sp. IMCC43444 TaxID=3459121 RepID=UPI0040410C36